MSIVPDDTLHLDLLPLLEIEVISSNCQTVIENLHVTVNECLIFKIVQSIDNKLLFFLRLSWRFIFSRHHEIDLAQKLP